MRHYMLIVLTTLLLVSSASARDEGGVKPTVYPTTVGV